MNSTFKKLAPFMLGVTALVGSRAMFSFFNDPEGPNLLIVLGAAGIIYLLSLMAYVFGSPKTQTKRFVLALFIQVLVISAGVYFASK